MKATSMYIYLEGARFFAHHGVDPQETIVGANFIIDLRLRTDFTHAAQTDELKGTVRYICSRQKRDENSIQTFRACL